MRYIGSKEGLLSFIDGAVEASGPPKGVFCDLFAGTTAVGRHFKRAGYQIISNDLMRYSYVFGKAYLENNSPPLFCRLAVRATHPASPLFDLDTGPVDRILAFLNQLPPEPGFMHANYSDEGTQAQPFKRMYFSAINAGRIDVVRNQIQQWIEIDLITESEYFVLLAALLEAIPGVSNTTGTYGAFLKYWEPRSQKPLTLRLPPLVYGGSGHQVTQMDAGALVQSIACDILYLDPPYNTRQYATNYHILETVARWDNPEIYGKSGLRPYKDQKSAFCQKETALQALREIVRHACCSLLLLSYNSEGIMPDEDIRDILAERGRVTVREQVYRRFRSDSDHSKRQYGAHTHIRERLYIVQTHS